MQVLDSSALMNVFEFESAVTIQEVLDEIRNRPTRERLENAFASGKLKLLEPSNESLDKVAQAVQKTKDSLSSTDQKLIALTIDIDAELVTDDLGMQNICLFLGVPFRGVRKEISRLFKRTFFCPACKRYYSKEGTCPTCGTALVKKVVSIR